MKQSELINVLGKCINNRKALMIEGAPGIGKTALVEATCNNLDVDLIVSHAVTCDPTDACGILWPDVASGKALTLPKEDLAMALAASKPLLWFLDDFAQASSAVQNSFSHLIHARRSGAQKLPNCVTFAIACNRRSDRAGSQPVVSTILSRCISAVTLTPDTDEWIEWALGNDIHPVVINHLRQRPEALYTETPTVGEAFSSPRSWAHASNILNFGLEGHLEKEMLLGAIGKGNAIEVAASAMLMKENIDGKAALENPNYEFSTKPDRLTALVSAAACYSKKSEKNIFAFAVRLHSMGLSEYAGLLISDAIKRNNTLCSSSHFFDFTKSDAAKLILGI